MYQEQAKFDQTQHDEQAAHFNTLLEDAQKRHADARLAMEKANNDVNRQLAQEKKDREAAHRAEMQYQGEFEKNFTANHDFLTEDPRTE